MKLSELARQAAGLQPTATARAEVERKQSRFTYSQGPMLFLAQQIVAQMQKLGWDAFVHCVYRSPEEQEAVYRRRASKARAYQSPHQYLLAADIIHKSKGWDVDPKFWDDLHACGQIIADKYGVQFSYGHKWKWTDSAHIELLTWRNWRDKTGKRVPSETELNQMFAEYLPKVWASRPKSALHLTT